MDEFYESLSKNILQWFKLVFFIIGTALFLIGFYIRIQAEHYLVIANTGYVNTVLIFAGKYKI